MFIATISRALSHTYGVKEPRNWWSKYIISFLLLFWFGIVILVCFNAIVFGEMLDCVQHVNQGYSLEEVVMDILADTTFPVLYGFPTGHTSGPNVMVPFGVRARLSLGSSSVFELLEPAVSV